MRQVTARVGALLAIWSILIGLALPYVAAAQPLDPDARCGPPVSAEHASQQLEADSEAAAPRGHCLICHWWSAINTTVVTSRTAVVRAGVLRSIVATASDRAPGLVAADSTSPRGPPARS